jgi:methionyl-tRNA formyltransferase
MTSSKLKVVLFGSPETAIPALREILRCPALTLLGAVTQPDRPAGRGRKPKAPAIETAALEAGLDVLQPESIGETHVIWGLKAFEADYFVVVAYGKILPPHVLEIPRLGCINLHFSLLPRYRGAAPVNWALIRGESVTGVTTMLIDEGLDSGPILRQREVKIEAGETAGALSLRLAELGAPLLVETLLDYASGSIKPVSQDDSQATRAPLLRKKHGLVDWERSAIEICNRWRGLDPWPGIFSHFRGEVIKFIELGLTQLSPPGGAAGMLHYIDGRLIASCGAGGALEILRVQLPGKKPLSARDFANGYHLAAGERLVS